MSALITLDFVRRFPHRFWISQWTSDEHYPDGYRYKVLSARTEPEGPIELVVVLEERSGDKTELKRIDVSRDAFDRTAEIFLSGLEETYDLDFEEVDCTAVRHAEQFERMVAAAGWNSFDIH